MNKIENDIIDWLQNYIEVPHKFYDYKYPPCPYARSTRVNGLLNVKSYPGKNLFKFVKTEISNHTTNDFNVCILALPNKVKWNLFLRFYLKYLNKKLISKNYYIQFGIAVQTQSKFSNDNKEPYFIIVINKLSDILDAHNKLLKTEYYKNWSDFHFYDVVERRNIMVKKYSQDQQ